MCAGRAVTAEQVLGELQPPELFFVSCAYGGRTTASAPVCNSTWSCVSVSGGVLSINSV